MTDQLVSRQDVADRIREYWDACGDLITTHNAAALAFDHLAAEYEAHP